MKNDRYYLCRCVTAVIAGCVLFGAGGCQKGVEKADFGPVFFPPAPNQPRLQFLTSFQGARDFDVDKPSFLESFVLGESEVLAPEIDKPYGVAIHDGKLYVCDVGQGNIKVLDVVNNTFSVFPSGRSLLRPVNIFIEPDGTKYVADSMGGSIVVFDASDKLVAYLGRGQGMKPLDVAVRGNRLYVTDVNSAQVLVLDKRSGEVLSTMGRKVTDRAQWAPDEFAMITDLTLDRHGNVYVSDKLKSRVTVFDSSGKYLRSYGHPGSAPDSIVRAKGIAVDNEDRVWVVDAGPACAVKVFSNEGDFLMFFGTLGTEPGQMYLPADVIIDFENVELFDDYAVKGAKIEFLVIVTNQYGDHKVSVYGFGTFPERYSMQGIRTTSEDESPAGEPPKDDNSGSEQP